MNLSSICRTNFIRTYAGGGSLLRLEHTISILWRLPSVMRRDRHKRSSSFLWIRTRNTQLKSWWRSTRFVTRYSVLKVLGWLLSKSLTDNYPNTYLSSGIRKYIPSFTTRTRQCSPCRQSSTLSTVKSLSTPETFSLMWPLRTKQSSTS